MREQIDALQSMLNKVVEFLVTYSFQVIGALIILVAGHYLARWAGDTLLKFLQKKKLDITLSKFLASVTRLTVLTFAIIIALNKFGITIAPFVAALGALAFGSSFAIQAPLSNYGAGLSLVMSRPFKVGDTISVGEIYGVVQDVKLSSTSLLTQDGVVITVPNRHIVGEIIHNSFENRMAETVVGISYDDDPEKTIAIVKKVLSGFSEIATNPPPQIGLQTFGDSSLNIAYRFWIPTVQFYKIWYAVNLEVYKALKKEGVTIPFPQREVRVLSGALGERA